LYLGGALTVAARLHRRLDVSDTLHRHAVLIISVDKLVFELADLVKENAELVGNVGNVFVASFAPV